MCIGYGGQGGIATESTQEAALAQLEHEAKLCAVDPGALEGSVRTVQVEVLPLQYVTNEAARIVVRATGDLNHGRAGETSVKSLPHDDWARSVRSLEHPRAE